MAELQRAVTVETLKARFSEAVEGVLAEVNRTAPEKQLRGLAIATADNVIAMVAFVMLEGDPALDDQQLFFSPSDWGLSTELPFPEFNAELERLAEGYPARREQFARDVFRACTAVLYDMDLPLRLGHALYLTVCDLSPLDYMVALESECVERLNAPETFNRWKQVFTAV